MGSEATNALTTTLTDLHQENLNRLALTMAQRGLTVFLGAGFSRESKLPDVRRLSLSMLHNALLSADSPFLPEMRQRLWETLKRLLLGENYHEWTDLKPDGDMVIEYQELERCAHQKCSPVWANQFLSFSRIAEILFRLLRTSEISYPHTVLCRLMGILPGGPNHEDWDRPASFAHHLLVQLMREGLIKRAYTTNYDCLVEDAAEALQMNLHVIRHSGDHGDPLDERTPVYHKLHGCRGALKVADNDPLVVERAAERIIVMDHDLLSWRQDMWAKEDFKTTVRRRPILFIGFSASDIVLDVTLHELAIHGVHQPLFVAPSLAFPYFQYFHDQNPSYDPLRATNVINRFGGPLMQELYPLAIRAHFESIGNKAPRLKAEDATRDFECRQTAFLEQGTATAINLVAEWAQMTATTLVTEAVGQSKSVIRRTPWSNMVRTRYTEGTRYSPGLALRDDQTTLDVVIPLVALTLIQHELAPLPSTPPVSMDTPFGSDEGQTLSVFHPTTRRQLFRLAIIPIGSISGPGHMLSWLREYFTYRSERRLDCTGRFVFITPLDLSQDQLSEITNLVRDCCEPSTSIEVWARHTTYSQGGNPG